MLDHVVLGVGDLQRSKSFYEQALRPLGIALLLERGEVVAGFGETGRSYFVLRGDREPSQPPLHFRATTHRTTTERSSSTPTATTSRRFATSPSRAGSR